MDFGCVKVSVWLLVVLRSVYGKWLCRCKCVDCCCVEVSVLILVVWRSVYEYWLCGG